MKTSQHVKNRTKYTINIENGGIHTHITVQK